MIPPVRTPNGIGSVVYVLTQRVWTAPSPKTPVAACCIKKKCHTIVLFNKEFYSYIFYDNEIKLLPAKRRVDFLC